MQADRSIKVVEEPLSTLTQHARIPISFMVQSVFHVGEQQEGRFTLLEERLDEPFLKDYDALESPTTWAERFDVSRWGLIAAYDIDGIRVGGAVIAFDTVGVDLLE